MALLALGIYAFNALARQGTPASPWVTRMSLPIDPTAVRIDPALSPDGRRLVWAASDGLHVRSLDALNDRVIPGTGGAQNPRFSYDGTSLAFQFENELRVVPLSGGSQRVLARVTMWPGYGQIGGAPPVWSHDGWVYFVSVPFVTFMPGKHFPGIRIMKVRHKGGDPQQVLPPDSMRIFVPSASLPGTNAVLGTAFTSRARSFGTTTTPNDNDLQVAVLDEKRGSIEVLLPGRVPTYEPQTNHIVFLRAGTLMAAKFSIRRLKLAGPPFPVEESIGDFGLARDGTLWSTTGPTGRTIPVSIDRKGTALEIVPERKDEDQVSVGEFSPDGNRIVVTLIPQGRDTSDVWMSTPSTGNLQRLTYGGAGFPTWSLDGKFVLFSGPRGVYQVRSDGSSPPELLLPDTTVGFLQAVYGGGIVFERGNGTDLDVGTALRTAGDSVRIIAGGKSNQEDPAVSPDGRWLAYESDATGQNEVYVLPLSSPGRAQRVSVAGGNNPYWSRDGRELFFRNGSSVFEAVQYRSDPPFQVVGRTELFNAQLYTGRFHPSPDGSRFLANKIGRRALARASSSRVTGCVK